MSTDKRNRLDWYVRTEYIAKAARMLSSLWMNEKSGTQNRRGLRAAFRRFRPDESGQPSMEMRGHIWAWRGSPIATTHDDDGNAHPGQSETGDAALTNSQLEFAKVVVDRAAVVTALVAASGDDGVSVPMGAALHRAGLSDQRLTRLLTSPSATRLQALHRALRVVARSNARPRWNDRDIRNVLRFLYGDRHDANEASKAWATEYFSDRFGDDRAEPKEDSDEKNPEQTTT